MHEKDFCPLARKTSSLQGEHAGAADVSLIIFFAFFVILTIRAVLVYLSMTSCSKSNSGASMRVLCARLKDKCAAALREKAYWTNQVWNYVNDLAHKVWQRELRFLSDYDLAPYTKGAGKSGLPLHSQTIQAITQEYAARRKQFKKLKLRWRGSHRSLGWIPFKASALRYRFGTPA